VHAYDNILYNIHVEQERYGHYCLQSESSHTGDSLIVKTGLVPSMES
jgi:hypothetical protein